MEQNSLQLNNVHESDFSGFINNGYNLQQPTNAYEISATSDTLSDINENSTVSPHETQRDIRVNNELDNNQQQYATSSATTVATMATSTYPAPQYDNPQYISNAPQYDNLPQYISNVAPAPQHSNPSEYVSPAPQLLLRINSPTMTVYESLDYHIIFIPKCPCPLVDSNNFNRQDASQ